MQVHRNEFVGSPRVVGQIIASNAVTRVGWRSFRETRSGEFATVSATNLPNGLVLGPPQYNATNVTVVVAAALQAAQIERGGLSDESQDLTTDTLLAFVAASVPRLRFGLLENVQFVVTDLPDNVLGLAAGNIIWIDRSAVGFGWFVDSTPDDDEEFFADSTGSLRAVAGGDADGKMDLLTVVMHELGHLLGLDDHADDPDDLLFETLAVGPRKQISTLDLDAWFRPLQ